ncbi:MAG: hypothetical protein PF450_04405 [Bacteroidales bacterium]|jgi:hypothetical protein|nr:hypothetical protein [Bacteroidales bacterium]
MMKNRMITASLVLAIIGGFTSCEKSMDVNDLEGVYVGAFSTSSSLKSMKNDSIGDNTGSAEITMMENNQIEVYCFGEAIDTTFMLDYYEHNDSVKVCLTGSSFESMYGHMLGDGHMGSMMGDIQDQETEWMHHMNDEHEVGDDHFGGFYMADESFTYSFNMKDASHSYYLKFHGVKE